MHGCPGQVTLPRPLLSEWGPSALTGSHAARSIPPRMRPGLAPSRHFTKQAPSRADCHETFRPREATARRGQACPLRPPVRLQMSLRTREQRQLRRASRTVLGQSSSPTQASYTQEDVPMFLSPDKLSGITCLSSLLPSMSRPSPLLNSSQTARPPPPRPQRQTHRQRGHPAVVASASHTLGAWYTTGTE